MNFALSLRLLLVLLAPGIFAGNGEALPERTCRCIDIDRAQDEYDNSLAGGLLRKREPNNRCESGGCCAVGTSDRPTVLLRALIYAYDGRGASSAAPWAVGQTPIYNFEVSGTHSYFVGNGGTLVHNACTVPKNNWGKQHGGTKHWNRMTQTADKMKQLGWRDIRVNRRQVDAAGNVVGRNRPDISGINPRTGQRHNIEFDTNPAASARHRSVVNRNDPAAKNTFIQIP